MSLANEFDIPCVMITVHNAKRTTRTLYTPIYELPLLEKRFSGIATVAAAAIPHDSSLPREMRVRRASFADEESRLRKKYKKMLSGAPLFDSIYGFGLFKQAFESAVAGTWTPDAEAAPAPESKTSAPAVHPAMTGFAEQEAPQSEKHSAPEDPAPEESAPNPLEAVRGVGSELAAALNVRGVHTVSELAEMSKEDLVAVPGVGAKSAESILDRAADLAFQGAEE